MTDPVDIATVATATATTTTARSRRPVIRCESCRSASAEWLVTFTDGAVFAVCGRCIGPAVTATPRPNIPRPSTAGVDERAQAQASTRESAGPAPHPTPHATPLTVASAMNAAHGRNASMHGSMNVRLNPVLLALGTLAGIVGGWGLYTMMTEIGHAPGLIGVISIAILELFAVGLGIHAVKVARDGDSPFAFNAAITLIAVFAAVVQLVAAIVEGRGVLFGLVMAMAPVAAITLWVVEMRRYFRLRGRAAGTVAPPRRTIEPAMWVRFPRQAWTAKKFALIDRTLGCDDAMKLGILHGTPPRSPSRRSPRRSGGTAGSRWRT